MKAVQAQNKHEQGFTLLEMILAVTIFSMIMLTVAMTLYTVQRSWQKISNHSNELKRYQMIDRLVDVAFRNAIPFPWTNDDNETTYCFKGESDSLLLTYLHRIGQNDSEGGIRFLRLYIESGNLIAEYRKTPILPDSKNDNDYKSKEVIAVNVRELEFTYVDFDSDSDDNSLEYSKEWDVDDEYNIPIAIQMKVTWNNGESEVWLRRTAGNSIVSTYGQRNDSSATEDE